MGSADFPHLDNDWRRRPRFGEALGSSDPQNDRSLCKALLGAEREFRRVSCNRNKSVIEAYPGTGRTAMAAGRAGRHPRTE